MLLLCVDRIVGGIIIEVLAENLALLRADGIEQAGTTLRESRDQVMPMSQRLATFTPQAAPRMT